MTFATFLQDASSATVILVSVGAAALALLLGIVLTALIRRLAARRNLVVEQRPPWRAPLTLLLVVVAVRGVLSRADAHQRDWIDHLDYVLDLALIAVVAWLLTVIVRIIQRAMLARYPQAGIEDRGSRHARTEINLVARVVEAVIVATAVTAMLWTVPALHRVGIGILASASVIAVIVGIAAQSTLGNLLAGIQIAFTDAIRIDDIVVVEGKWGRIEEISLTYVAVRVWDNTTLILPCMYFTTTPFQNWTHRGTTVSGSVEIAVDWRAPLDAMRQELGRLLERSPHCEQQQGELYVGDATDVSIKLVAVVTATSGDSIGPLCWEVREGLVTFLQRNYPEALPRDHRDGLPPVPSASAAES